MQSIATLIAGSILGLVFIWKVGLVGIACIPLLISPGYIRLVCSDVYIECDSPFFSQRVVVLKDQTNKKAHAESAKLASEAAGSIRTVAALTREDDCLRIYSENLEEPLRKSNRSAIWSNLLYAFTQAQVFWVIALVFWWGATLVSRQEASTFAFFIGLMVCFGFPLLGFRCDIYHPCSVNHLWRYSSWQCIHFRPGYVRCTRRRF